MSAFYHWDGEDLILAVQVQPRASQMGIVGVQGDRLKIKLTAAPIEGQANADLCKFLAKLFGVAKSKVILLNGETSREKRLKIQSPKKTPEFMNQSELF
ncbi:MAG: DUF167 family protein [Thiotrichaceae bacterium]|nr:DUF167 family protein [Thiotrichaceae bacterium]